MNDSVNKMLLLTEVEVHVMNNFEKIRQETETIEGMAKMFCSTSWDGNGHVFRNTQQDILILKKRHFKRRLIG